MSEQQVLPPRSEIIEALRIRNEWLEGQVRMNKEIADNQTFHATALRASLAQSEAERERLHLENIKLINDASVWRNRAIGAEEEIREGGRGIDLRRGFER